MRVFTSGQTFVLNDGKVFQHHFPRHLFLFETMKRSRVINISYIMNWARHTPTSSNFTSTPVHPEVWPSIINVVYYSTAFNTSMIYSTRTIWPHYVHLDRMWGRSCKDHSAVIHGQCADISNLVTSRGRSYRAGKCSRTGWIVGPSYADGTCTCTHNFTA